MRLHRAVGKVIQPVSVQQQSLVEIAEDRVEHVGRRFVPRVPPHSQRTAHLALAPPDQCRVIRVPQPNGHLSQRRLVQIPVALKTPAVRCPRPRRLDAQDELHRPPVALVGVKVVVLAEGRYQVVGVDRAAPPLKPVVRSGKHFHIFQDRPAAHRPNRQPVEFAGRSKFVARVPDRHVAQRSRAVRVVVSSKYVFTVLARSLGPFINIVDRTGRVARGVLGAVEHRLAQQHHPAPERRLGRRNVPVQIIPLGRENDRLVHRARRIKFASPRHPQRRHQIGDVRAPERHVG